MGKTWRGEERRSHGRRRETAGPITDETNPSTITLEWAWERVRDHVMSSIQSLVREGIVLDGEEDIHAEGFKKALAESIGGYDPTFIGPNGRTCSPSHYCFMIIDRRILNIRRNVARVKMGAVERPISSLPPVEAKVLGFISEESISDDCRNIRELWYRMDLNVFHGMLTPLEHEVLDFRLDELSERDIALELGICRNQVVLILRRIRNKARECGFFSSRDIKNGVDKKYIQPKPKIR